MTCLALAACGGGASGNNTAAPAGDTAQADPDDGKAECAIGPGAQWTRNCLVDRSDGPDGSVLTLRHPDGGFRRFRIVTDGRGLIPADGAEKANIALIDGGKIELTIANDRYRLPATVEAARR